MPRSRAIVGGGARPGRQRAPVLPGDQLDGLVIAMLAEAGRPLSAYALGDAVRAERGTANLPAIYRSLDRLCERGAVQRVASLSSYRLCDVAGAMLTICRACGTTAPVAVAAPHAQLIGALAANGFRADDLIVEAVGLCTLCRQDGPATPPIVPPPARD